MLARKTRNAEPGLEARIADLGRRREQNAKLTATIVNLAARTPYDPTERIVASLLTPTPDPTDDPLAAVRAELVSRLSEDISPERRAVLSRRELAQMVGAAAQGYLIRRGINVSPLMRRDLITRIIQDLLTSPETLAASPRKQWEVVESAKEKIQATILDQMDVLTAAQMPRAEFEVNLTNWVKELLAQHRLQLNFVEQRELVRSLIADMLGLGPLEPLMVDETINDIMVNGPNEIYVERHGKIERTDAAFRDEQHLMNVCTKIVTRIGRRIDEAHPLVDARLPDGSRVNIIIPPLALDGAMISVRKFKKKAITLDVMAANGSISSRMAMVLKVAARCRLNILVSGGTGSGKTTLLNALSQMIDSVERTITIEDAAELQIQQPHVGRLETRTANIEGTGEVKMRDLLKNALRMRPDRIIIGECRGEEAFDMLQAMNTGHDGSMSTIHANSPRDALSRLENMIGMAGANLPSKAVRTQIASAVQLICQVSRMRDGVRRVTHITEVIGMENDVIITQDLFTFKFQGESIDGKLCGTFESSGIRPAFLSRAEYYGLAQTLLEAI